MDDQVKEIGRVFADRLRGILDTKLHGAYLYGSVVFSDAFPARDIDFHVILESDLTDGERAALEAMHTSLAAEYPPLGGEMDGFYLLLSDARRTDPPRSQLWHRAVDESWALHCEHVRRGKHHVLHGPEPLTIYPTVSWEQIREALFWEWQYVETHIYQYPAHGILNSCRIVYSFRTRDVVVSKAAASTWALEALPHWTDLIEAARQVYMEQAATDADILARRERLEAFHIWARNQIGKKRGQSTESRSTLPDNSQIASHTERRGCACALDSEWRASGSRGLPRTQAFGWFLRSAQRE